MVTYRRYDELDGLTADEVLDDRIVEEVIAGRLVGERADLQALSSFVNALRSMPATMPPVVRPELVTVFETGLSPGDASPAADPVPSSRIPRRRRMLETLSAFVATLAGKVVLGTAAVAASVGGVHAAGVVEVPGLPDRAPAAVVDVPAAEDAAGEGSERSGGRPEVATGQQPDSPGVDGSTISERATSGEPQEDGKAFGTSIADEATEGTPAEGLPGNGGDAAQDRQPETPAGGDGIAEDKKPDTLPAGDADPADDNRPDDAASADVAEDHRPGDTSTGRP